MMVVCLLILPFQAIDSVISGNQIYSPSILIDMLCYVISYHIISYHIISQFILTLVFMMDYFDDI